MSHEKVRSICINEKKQEVIITSAVNNCRPLDYYKNNFPFYTNLLKEKGKKAVEIEILRGYEEGNFQDGVNKYTKALKVLFYVFKEEYKRFNWNWNLEYNSKEWKERDELRQSEEFKELLRKALDYKISKNKFIITNDHDGEKVYAKVCPTCIKWSRFKEKATKFDFEEDARNHIYKSYKDEWKILEVKNE